MLSQIVPEHRWVMHSLRPRRSFTLVELIVVMGVLIILMAIAVPAYLKVRDTADDTSASASLTTSYRNAKAAWADSGAYPATSTLLANRLRASEPGFTFTPGPVTTLAYNEVSVERDTPQRITLCTPTKKAMVLCLRADEDGTLLLSEGDLENPFILAASGATVARSWGPTLALAKAWLPTETQHPGEGAPANSGGTGWVTAPVASTPAAPLNGGFRFDGVDDNIVAATTDPTAAQNTTARTIEAWVKVPAGATNRTILGRHNNGAGGFYMRIMSNGVLEGGLENGAAYYDVRGASRVDDNAWHHLTMVWRPGTAVDLYVDGTKIAVTPSSGGTGSNPLVSYGINSGSVMIGSVSAGVDRFIGDIDEVRYSLGARYSGASFTVPTTMTADGSTIGLWDFASGAAAPVFGSQISAAGTLQGGITAITVTR